MHREQNREDVGKDKKTLPELPNENSIRPGRREGENNPPERRHEADACGCGRGRTVTRGHGSLAGTRCTEERRKVVVMGNGGRKGEG